MARKKTGDGRDAGGAGVAAASAPEASPGSQLTIQRIGYKEGYVTIEAGEHVAGTDYRKEIKLRSAEAPHPDFAASFEALAGGVRKLLQVPRNWAENAITVTKISIGETGGIQGASITGKAALETSDAPFNFATPYLPFSVEGESNRPVMPPEILEHIRTAEARALDYLKGSRAQGALPL